MLSKPIIVLVHGALTDASIWSDVLRHLHAKGFEAIAPALPLRGLQTDAEYLSAFIDSLDKTFVLVGHSYAGSVISHSLLQKKGLKSLVFISAFVQDTAETAGELNARWPGSKLGDRTTTIRYYPGGSELYLKPEHFAEVYAGDLNAAQVAVLSASQRPIDPVALGESFSGTPTWRTVPSFALISTEDQSIPASALRAMALRADARVVEAKASHASPLSVPMEVTQLIEIAAVYDPERDAD